MQNNLVILGILFFLALVSWAALRCYFQSLCKYGEESKLNAKKEKRSEKE